MFKNFMHLAIEEAEIALQKGEIPVGAVIIENNQLIAKAHNLTFQNPLLHVEIQVIQAAQKILNQKYLENCEIFVTLFPCQMCFHALHLIRIKKIFVGAPAEKDFQYNFDIYDGIEKEKCSKLLKDFFAKKRCTKS